MHIEIEYCVPSGHLRRAAATQQDLLEGLGNRLEAVTLRTGSGGVFKIQVDGEQVRDAASDGYDLDATGGLVDERPAA